jgi:hypothetical protein
MPKISCVMLLSSLVAAPSVHAQSVTYPSPERQIAAAVTPMPAKLRANATVLGYGRDGKFTTLRKGSNDMTCIADDPSRKQFHVACYHNSLEPFMASGRVLHAKKLNIDSIDVIRGQEINHGLYAMPKKPAALYEYFAPRDSVDTAAGAVNGARYLYVVYIPYATPASTGLPAEPIDGGPWLMYPGKPWAHIMIQPQKTARVELK